MHEKNSKTNSNPNSQDISDSTNRLTDNLPEMIFKFHQNEDKRGGFVYVSNAAREIYELEPDQLLKNPRLAWRCIHPEDFKAFREQIEQCEKELRPLNWQGRLIGQSSYRLKWVRIYSCPQQLPTGGLKWIGTISDITNLKQAEKELEHAKNKAEQELKWKEDFLATMSHEIRTPLNGISGMTYLLKDVATPEQEEYMELLQHSVQGLKGLVNNILDYSKLNSGQMMISKARMSIQNVLKTLRETHMFRARENRSEIIFEIDENIPDQLISDEFILTQVLSNLLGNATKFTKDGIIKLSMKLKGIDGDKYRVHFEVSDSGSGISEENLESIFDKFKQAGTGINHSGGTGLGLSICRQYLDLLNSRLAVESELGKGAAFSFELDVTAYKSKTAKKPMEDPFDILHDIPIVQNILLVEDVMDSREMIAKYLNRFPQLNVDTASNGLEALSKVEQKQYDMIFMDLRIPEIEGRECAIRIRKLPHFSYEEVPIVAFTATNMSIQKDPVFNDVVLKPASTKMLMEKVIMHLATRPLADSVTA